MFPVWMQLSTSVNSIETSLPTVIAAMTFLTASFFFSILGLASSSLSSPISPAAQQAKLAARVAARGPSLPQELWGAADGAPFFVVWKYLLSFPAALLPPKLGSLVFILSTWQRRGGRVQKCATP